MGDFWKFLVTIFLKVPQLFENLWGYLEKHHFLD